MFISTTTTTKKPQKMAPKFEVIVGVASFLEHALYLD
jgi:hypothetical protein